MKVTVAGAGSWGTALARLLAVSGEDVTLWGHDAAYLEEFKRTGENARYLPGVALPKNWKLTADLEDACTGAEVIVIAVPSKAFREVASRLAPFRGVAVSVTKGIEFSTGLTMCGVLGETMPKATPVALSGPTLAMEVAKDTPSAIVAASVDQRAAEVVQGLFHRPAFRVYTSDDTMGVELGGALKNVIAIAAGMCDGIGFGDNSKAALITRGIAEMRRLGVVCGAMPETFAGLSGLGDLTVTCFSKLSRNRTLGERLGKGEALVDILANSVTVAEGCPTARSAHKLAKERGAVTPIIDQVYAILYEHKDLKEALRDLLGRDQKSEQE